MKKALYTAILAWLVACVCVLIAKADLYLGDANAEFSEALRQREEAYMANRKEVKVTFYCCERYAHICNAGYPFLTASGKTPRPGMCAADDLPLGTQIWLDWEDDGVIDEYLTVEDRFGGRRKSAIDIVVPTHKEALERGRKTAVIYWCEE